MKIGFFGTPELAREILLDFLGDPTFEVVYIVSQPDRPVGREQIITPSPVSEVALEKDILLFRPEKVRGNTDFIDTLRNLSVDYIVVVAYGQILPQDILNLPKYLCINIHGSILPSYRWASPIQSALLCGETRTGVTIMEMSLWMDEGDILRIEEITIDRYETSLSLFEKFSQVCGPICRSTLIDHKEGRITPVPQPGGATYTKKITKEEGQVDFTSESAETIYRKYQAFTPWPGIWTVVAGKRCKILRVGHPEDPVSTGILIPTFSGNIEIFEVQFEGKKPTPATRSLLDWFFR